MPRVLVNIQSSQYWSVHFIGPDNKTRIGPWLLLDSHDEARAILHWGKISDDATAEHESCIRRWSTNIGWPRNHKAPACQAHRTRQGLAVERVRTPANEKSREISTANRLVPCDIGSVFP